MNKALESMVEKMLAVTKNCEEKVLAISHCNCPERAKRVCERIEKLAHFKKRMSLLKSSINMVKSVGASVLLNLL